MASLPHSGFPEGVQAPAEALARFDAALRACATATGLLESWMAQRLGDGAAPVRVRLRRAETQAAGEERAARLGIAPGATVIYRQVWLIRRGRLLSEAENWYVPDRLDSAMNRILAQGAVPFGRVVGALHPVRAPIAVERLWDGTGPTVPPRLLRHRALMRDARGQALCEVCETYMRSVVRGG